MQSRVRRHQRLRVVGCGGHEGIDAAEVGGGVVPPPRPWRIPRQRMPERRTPLLSSSAAMRLLADRSAIGPTRDLNRREAVQIGGRADGVGGHRWSTSCRPASNVHGREAKCFRPASTCASSGLLGRLMDLFRLLQVLITTSAVPQTGASGSLTFGRDSRSGSSTTASTLGMASRCGGDLVSIVVHPGTQARNLVLVVERGVGHGDPADHHGVMIATGVMAPVRPTWKPTSSRRVWTIGAGYL